MSRSSFMKSEFNPRSKKLNSINLDIENQRERFKRISKSKKESLLKFKSKYIFLRNQLNNHKQTKNNSKGRYKKCKAQLTRINELTKCRKTK